MALQKIKKFTDYNHYPEEASPTTDADMQDYMGNQNDILTALTKRLWQPLTAYNLGDIVMSDAMADGLVAVCIIAGTTTAIEPTWVANEETVVDGTCTWIMRPAYCYGLATAADVEAIHGGESAEASRLLSLGVLDKIFEIIQGKFTNLFGDENVLPFEHGGTGQTSAAAVRNALGLGNTTGALPVDKGGTGSTNAANAIKALIGSSAIGSTSKPVYYAGDGTLKACSTSLGASSNGGIIAANLAQNGYVKFANGLIIQWGSGTASTNDTAYTTNFPLAFASSCYGVDCQSNSHESNSDANGITVTARSTKSFTVKKHLSGNNTVTFTFWAYGK